MRSLSDAGCDVVGADKRRLPFGLHSRCTSSYEKIEDAASADFVTSLRKVIDQHEPDVLLPIGVARQASQARETLRTSTELLSPDFSTFSAVDDKRLIVEQCRESGVHCPDLLILENARNSLRERAVDAVVVKPRFNFGGGTGVTIVTDADDLDCVVGRTENRYGETLITEFVPGPDSANFVLQVLFDRESRLIGHFLLQKLRLQPARVGISALTVTAHRPDLLRSVLPLFTRLRWQGPADIEFKIDSRTGEASLIEVNARFSGAVGFAIGCGVDLALLTCKAALGEVLPESTAPAYPADVKCWSPIMYARAIGAAALSGSNLSKLPVQIFDELRGQRIGSPYQMLDPAPSIGKALDGIRSYLTGRRDQVSVKPLSK
jgi:predicted ATP-grasp superfamily ATP-dependent carboligase